MTDESIGIIYCIKGHGYDDLNTEENIAEFLRQHRNTNYRFTHEELTQELRKVMVDYLETANNPLREMRRYFLLRDHIWRDWPEWHQMSIFLGQTQVRQDECYINGFRDIPRWYREDKNE